mmetsp:Transcript_15422/g.43135  ORF Transcript_15422/g.43135 Transcript_15422/m.43135 type:complete len:437 (-) Transcript_15422:2609-3919(-)
MLDSLSEEMGILMTEANTSPGKDSGMLLAEVMAKIGSPAVAGLLRISRAAAAPLITGRSMARRAQSNCSTEPSTAATASAPLSTTVTMGAAYVSCMHTLLRMLRIVRCMDSLDTASRRRRAALPCRLAEEICWGRRGGLATNSIPLLGPEGIESLPMADSQHEGAWLLSAALPMERGGVRRAEAAAVFRFSISKVTQSRTIRVRVSAPTGFWMTSSMPLSRQTCRCRLRQVIPTIGTRFSPAAFSIFRISRVAEGPSMTGMTMSISTKWYTTLSTAASASRPCVAMSQLQPALWMARRIACCMVGLSSTSSTRALPDARLSPGPPPSPTAAAAGVEERDEMGKGRIAPGQDGRFPVPVRQAAKVVSSTELFTGLMTTLQHGTALRTRMTNGNGVSTIVLGTSVRVASHISTSSRKLVSAMLPLKAGMLMSSTAKWP